MFKIKICPCLRRAVDNLLHEISVVGMNSLEYQLQRRLHRSIVLEDVVGFLRAQVPDRSIIKHHALPRPDRVMKHGLGQVRWRDGCLSNGDLDSALAGRGLRLDLLLIAPEKDEQTPLGSCMLNRKSHELFDQLGEENLAGECLGGFDYSLDVQLPDQ